MPDSVGGVLQERQGLALLGCFVLCEMRHAWDACYTARGCNRGMRWLLPLVLVLVAACGDSRAAQVEKCVAASVRDGNKEGNARIVCMRSAYGGTSP